MQAKGWSVPATSRRVLERVADLSWTRACLLDVGAGRGPLCRVHADRLHGERGLEPRDRVQLRGPHPARPDAVASLDGVEHAEDRSRFPRELAGRRPA